MASRLNSVGGAGAGFTPVVQKNQASSLPASGPRARPARSDVFEAGPAPSPAGTPGGQAAWVNPGQLALGNAPTGNGFHISLSGHYPPVAAGGFFTELHQGALTAENSLKAEESIASNGQSPSDSDVQSQLRSLHLTPVASGSPTSVADYTSNLPGVSPAQAYSFFTHNPAAVFGAAGLTLRPAPTSLHNGDRIMIQDGHGTPAVWLPVEVKLNPANNEVDLSTLDGHPFRGTNNFKFVADGHGGTTVQQESIFQGSSQLIATMGQGGLDRQHQTWQAVHAFLAQNLKGGPIPGDVKLHGSAAPGTPLQNFRATTSRIHLDQGASVQQLKVNVNIPDTYRGNLKVSLVSPSGKSVNISNREGGAAHDIIGSYDLSSAFAGEEAKGDWTLVVQDQGSGDVGTLQDWSLDIAGGPSNTP